MTAVSDMPPYPLRRWRNAQGLTLQVVADGLGISKNRLSEIESGQGCSLDTALKIELFTDGAVAPRDLRPEPAPATDAAA